MKELENIAAFVKEQRDRCLWFLAPTFVPKTREQCLRALEYIRHYGDRDAYLKAGEMKTWLCRDSNK